MPATRVWVRFQIFPAAMCFQFNENKIQLIWYLEVGEYGGVINSFLLLLRAIYHFSSFVLFRCCCCFFFFNFKTVKLMTWTSKHHSQTLDWKRKKSDSFIDIPRRNTTGPNAVLKFPWQWVEISKSKPGFFLLTHYFLQQEIKEV